MVGEAIIAAGEPGPLVLADLTVAPDWVDYNGHMNDAAYALAFSRAGDRWMDAIGLDAAARAATGHTLYTLQIMLHYFREAKEGAALRVSAQVLEFDAKRAQLWMEMRSPADGPVIAATEQLYLCVHQGAETRAAPWPEAVRARLRAMAEAHSTLPAPPQAGRGIALKRG